MHGKSIVLSATKKLPAPATQKMKDILALKDKNPTRKLFVIQMNVRNTFRSGNIVILVQPSFLGGIFITIVIPVQT